MSIPPKFLPLIEGLISYLRGPVRELGVDEVCDGFPVYYENNDECFWVLVRRSLLTDQDWTQGQAPTAEMKAVIDALIAAHRAAVGTSPLMLRTKGVPQEYRMRLDVEWRERWPGMSGVDEPPQIEMLPGVARGPDHVQPFLIH